MIASRVTLDTLDYLIDRTRGLPQQVHLPTVRVTSQKRIQGTGKLETVTRDRTRGFGFVQFLCPRDASRVVKVRQCVLTNKNGWDEKGGNGIALPNHHEVKVFVVIGGLLACVRSVALLIRYSFFPSKHRPQFSTRYSK